MKLGKIIQTRTPSDKLLHNVLIKGIINEKPLTYIPAEYNKSEAVTTMIRKLDD